MKFPRLYNTEEHRAEVKEALRDGRLLLILRAFFFPQMARAFLIRLLLVILSAWLFFKFICLPLVIRGGSMLPTYPERGFLFCWAPGCWFHSPRRGEVVIMRYGKGVMLLKRVIGLPGDSIEFRRGQLIRNGQPVSEPYILGPSDWTLPERTVAPDHYYLVGDNRSIPLEMQVFGEMHRRYLAGVPLW